MSERIEPNENDILMGRGGKNNQHIGNEKLRDLARKRCEDYRMSSKKEKSSISRDLVRQVRQMHPPGRFLKKDSVSGLWEDVGDEVAREKASQAVRDAVSQKYGNSGNLRPHQMRYKKQASIPTTRLHRRASSDPFVAVEYSSDSSKTKMNEWRGEAIIRPSASVPPHSHHSSRSHSNSTDYTAATYAPDSQPHSDERRRYVSYSSVSPFLRPTGRQNDYERHDRRNCREYDEEQEWVHYGRPENQDRNHYGHNDRHEHHERPLPLVTASPAEASSAHYPSHHHEGPIDYSTQHTRHQYPTQQLNPRQGSSFDSSVG